MGRQIYVSRQMRSIKFLAPASFISLGPLQPIGGLSKRNQDTHKVVVVVVRVRDFTTPYLAHLMAAQVVRRLKAAELAASTDLESPSICGAGGNGLAVLAQEHKTQEPAGTCLCSWAGPAARIAFVARHLARPQTIAGSRTTTERPPSRPQWRNINHWARRTGPGCENQQPSW